MNNDPLLITLPLSQLVALLPFGFDGFIELPIDLGRQIQLVDADEQWVHVDLPAVGKVNETLKRRVLQPTAILWSVRDWHISVERWAKQKARAEADRIAWNKKSANITAIMRALQPTWLGLDEGQLRYMAEKVVSKWTPELIKEQFKVEIER